MELDNFYPISIDKALEWCPDVMIGEDVEFKAGFTSKIGPFKCWKFWGTVLKGTTVRHGFNRCIHSKNGYIMESSYKNDKTHGYTRFIYNNGEYVTGYRKNGHNFGEWIEYDPSNKEMNRRNHGDF